MPPLRVATEDNGVRPMWHGCDIQAHDAYQCCVRFSGVQPSRTRPDHASANASTGPGSSSGHGFWTASPPSGRRPLSSPVRAPASGLASARLAPGEPRPPSGPTAKRSPKAWFEELWTPGGTGRVAAGRSDWIRSGSRNRSARAPGVTTPLASPSTAAACLLVAGAPNPASMSPPPRCARPAERTVTRESGWTPTRVGRKAGRPGPVSARRDLHKALSRQDIAGLGATESSCILHERGDHARRRIEFETLVEPQAGRARVGCDCVAGGAARASPYGSPLEVRSRCRFGSCRRHPACGGASSRRCGPSAGRGYCAPPRRVSAAGHGS